MNAVEAFSHREEQLLCELAQAKDMDQAAAACVMALEQTACELAQDEQDENARQRQQAVMAALRCAPQMLRSVTARGEIVLAGVQKKQETQMEKLQRYAKWAGAFLLSALAVHEIIDGDMTFAALQLLGGALLLWGGRSAAGAVPDMEARGIPCADAKAMVRAMQALCQAADICVSDLSLLESDAAHARLSGTADDAMLDLLTALMEAKASGRDALAMRSLSQAEQYLHMLGVELISYDPSNAQVFDILPTMGEARTIRPAMMKDGQLLRRGAAALNMERGVGA